MVFRIMTLCVILCEISIPFGMAAYQCRTIYLANVINAYASTIIAFAIYTTQESQHRVTLYTNQLKNDGTCIDNDFHGSTTSPILPMGLLSDNLKKEKIRTD